MKKAGLLFPFEGKQKISYLERSRFQVIIDYKILSAFVASLCRVSILFLFRITCRLNTTRFARIKLTEAGILIT